MDEYLLKKLDQIEVRIHQRLDSIEVKVDDHAKDTSAIKVDVASLPCTRHDDKIKTLQRVVYGAVAVILLSWLATLTNINSNASVASINTNKAIVKTTK